MLSAHNGDMCAAPPEICASTMALSLPTAHDSDEETLLGTAHLDMPLPRNHFPSRQHPPSAVYQAIRDELLLDGNSRQNLATFCQTWLEPEVHRLLDDCVDKNMIDKDEYPQTAELEDRCVKMIANLWNAPDRDPVGCSTTGSSEAAMLGGMAMKWRWRARQQVAGRSTDRPNLVCGPVQVCWHKFARYWDVELREIPMEEGRLLMTPAEVIARCDENTIGVVPTLGVTFNGRYEAVKEVSEALDELQRETGLDIPIHVDGASGGFLAPFCAPDLAWDFRLPRVKSINASGHKFGLAPLGCGWVVWRQRADLPKELIFDVNYLGGSMPTFALNFSRPGGQVVAQYYNFVRLGRDGYTKLHASCYRTASYLAREIASLGPFELLFDGDPAHGIPAVCWTIRDGVDANYTLFDLADRLRMRGWQVPAYTLPARREDVVVQRILIRADVSRDLASILIRDMKTAIDFLTRSRGTLLGVLRDGTAFSH